MLAKYKYHLKINLFQEGICGKSLNGFTYKLFMLIKNLNSMVYDLELDSYLIMMARKKLKMD